MYKKLTFMILIGILVVTLTIFTGCEEEDMPDAVPEEEEENGEGEEVTPIEKQGDFPDGRYRGAFVDRGQRIGEDMGIVQVVVDFYLEDNEVYDIGYRTLAWSHDNYLHPDDPENEWPKEDLEALAEQHEELLEYLDGEDISVLEDLHNPGDIAEDKEGTGEVLDTWTAATLRSNKVLHAVRDALNNGVYVPDE
ncbi:hypothetical protein [Natranaerofaba carboxydovora]|uniref:hypothetical protein n=1 Tax=Natranaerofaba carboxydovora TaxID=2742683 RepID=UPI001F129C1D|nr:hypothetical protein [Natranaerofaba carboxydovora]UMZ72919.1 hypothetical protein ACONDI_00458 [Natranaerofaba carboxydovora]